MTSVTYQGSPRPLTDRERELLKRIFSDFFEVPGEWKSALRADLERDPPILGVAALGGQSVSPKTGSVIDDSVAAGANISLDKLASFGQIGNSSEVEIFSAAIRLGGDVIFQRALTNRLDLLADTLQLGATNDLALRRAPNRFEVVADTLRLGVTNDLDLRRGTSRLEVVADTLRLGATNDLDLRRGAAGRLEVVADNLRLGAAGDIDLQRTAADRLDLLDVLRVTISSGSAVLAPLWLNINGTVLQVQVGAAGTGPGGTGRALWVT